MFYSWPVTVTTENVESNKSKVSMPMSSGVIHQIDIAFPDNCDHDVRVQIWDANLQLWPSNRTGTIRGDAGIISFRDFYEMRTENNILTAYAWLEELEESVTVWVHVGVLPRSILQPFSLAELLRAVQRS